jgi:hypothetical protein
MQARPELMGLFEEAHEVISDPNRRRLYDQTRKKTPKAAPSETPAHANGHAPAAKGRRRKAAAADVAPARPAPATATARTPKESPPRKKAPEPAPAAPRSTRNGKPQPQVAPPAGEEVQADRLEFVRSIASTSATVLRIGGKGSFNLAKKASEALRDVLMDVEPLEEDGLTPDEERVLMDRLSSVPPGTALPPAAVDPPAQIIAPAANEPSQKTTRLPEVPRDRTPAGAVPPPSRRAPLARLVITQGPSRGKSFDVEAVPFTIGGDEGCDVALPGLAAEQARLLHRDGDFVLYSLSDEPKIKVEGDAIAWIVLHDGDSVEVGPYRLRFESTSVSMAPA